MALNYGGSSTNTTSAAGVLSAGRTALSLLLLRVFGGLPMIYFQGWDQAIRAYRYIWEDKPWALVTDMAEKAIFAPNVMASILIFFLLSSSFAVLIGFLTRINATIMLLCTLLILLFGLLGQFLISQTLVVYAGIFATLIMSGPGLISLDALLTKRRAKKKGY